MTSNKNHSDRPVWRAIDWRSTLLLFVSRAFASGLLWTLIVALLDDGTLFASIGSWMFFPFVVAMIWAPTGLMNLVFLRRSESITFGTVLIWVISVCLCLGDPVVYAINRILPRLYRSSDMTLINLSIILMIQRSLHQCVLEGRMSAIVSLLRAGESPNEPDEDGKTPLHIGADLGSAEIISTLLDAGADTAAKDRTGSDPWDYAKDRSDLQGTDAYRRLSDAAQA